ncbi:MAG: hypothetical protein HY241_15730 [Actinobacteria bacterium]|nr:hypothetical protein [Actinomycetota bacterium]
MSHLRSGLVAAWGTAWLAGRVGYDEVAARVTGTDEPHRVTGLDEMAPDGVPLLWALYAWRERGTAALRSVLPVPGDPRGLPAPGAFSAAAMSAGEAVFGADLGLVPEIGRHGPARDQRSVTVRWRAYAGVPPVPRDDLVSLREAERDLTVAIRAATEALSGPGAASWHPRPIGGVARLPQRPVAPPLPSGHDPRAVRLLAQADRLAAILERTGAAGAGDGLSASATAARQSALRPLWTAVRRARIAAYNA